MARPKTEFPRCISCHNDCFACGNDCKCYLLTDTNFKTEKCTFYKSRYSVKPFRPVKGIGS